MGVPFFPTRLLLTSGLQGWVRCLITAFITAFNFKHDGSVSTAASLVQSHEYPSEVQMEVISRCNVDLNALLGVSLFLSGSLSNDYGLPMFQHNEYFIFTQLP